MFVTSLPILPPPSTSLLPPLHTPNIEAAYNPAQAHHHPHQRRPKHAGPPRSTLSVLSLDERAISQRKMAIAMYGYSWLKPAGCTRTMLGRREEELEREEVERQLREVEMQEQVAAEGEEAERLATMRQQEEMAAMNGGMLPGERDLDEDIPEAEEEGDDDEEGEGAGEESDGLGQGEEDMDGDLDDDIPDGDAGESDWVYDTNRDPDTDSEDGQNGSRLPATSRHGHTVLVGVDDVAETEAMVNAMLDEDELGEIVHHRDLDDDLPDMDADMDMDMDMDGDGDDYDLDNDVPEAGEADEGEWQHTDTELDESEMDISILPPLQTQPAIPSPVSAIDSHHLRSSFGSDSIGPGTTHEEMRRTSGNLMLPPALPQSSSQPPRRHPQFQPQPARRGAVRRVNTPQMQGHYQTPVIGTGDSISNLISSDLSSEVGSSIHRSMGYNVNRVATNAQTTHAESDGTTIANQYGEDSVSPQRRGRSWLNPAGARRNLFGRSIRIGAPVVTTVDNGSNSGLTPEPPTMRMPQTQSQQQQQQQKSSNSAATQSTDQNPPTSSGGLFTPSPRIPPRTNNDNDTDISIPTRNATASQNPPHRHHLHPDDSSDDQQAESEMEPPRSRTRSGRLLGGIQIGRRRRRP